MPFSSGKLALFTAFLLGCVSMASAGHSRAEFPLRVHVFGHNGVSHYTQRMLDAVDGEGRANLFENGQPTAFDFSYRCAQRLENSIGYETYPARWRKPGRAIEILLPVPGKPDGFVTCSMDVTMKTGVAYFFHNGFSEEPSANFRKWMDKTGYDPEHDRMPIIPPPAVTPPPAAPPAAHN